jgi:hypothetical protein
MGGWRLTDSEYANPFKVTENGREECLRKYREYLYSRPDLLDKLKELSGKKIACFCSLKEKCHRDTLVEVGKEKGYW